MDESPNVMDVDDVAGNDEIVVVELVNLLSTHGCFTAPSCLIRSTRLSGPAAEAPDNQRRSKKRSDIRIVKMRVCLFFFFSVFFYQNEGERRKVKKRNEGMMMVWGL